VVTDGDLDFCGRIVCWLGVLGRIVVAEAVVAQAEYEVLEVVVEAGTCAVEGMKAPFHRENPGSYRNLHGFRPCH